MKALLRSKLMDLPPPPSIRTEYQMRINTDYFDMTIVKATQS